MSAVEKMPERINVMKVVTYDVKKISDDMFEATGLRPIHAAEVVDWIEDWIKEDFGCGYGHEVRLDSLIFQDEDGNDI